MNMPKQIRFSLSKDQLGKPIRDGEFTLTVTKTMTAMAMEDARDPVVPIVQYECKLLGDDGTTPDGTYYLYSDSKLVQMGKVCSGTIQLLNVEEPCNYEIIIYIIPV